MSKYSKNYCIILPHLNSFSFFLKHIVLHACPLPGTTTGPGDVAFLDFIELIVGIDKNVYICRPISVSDDVLYKEEIGKKAVGRDMMLNMVKEDLTEKVTLQQRSEGNETWVYGWGGSTPTCTENSGPERGAHVLCLRSGKQAK